MANGEGHSMGGVILATVVFFAVLYKLVSMVVHSFVVEVPATATRAVVVAEATKAYACGMVGVIFIGALALVIIFCCSVYFFGMALQKKRDADIEARAVAGLGSMPSIPVAPVAPAAPTNPAATPCSPIANNLFA